MKLWKNLYETISLRLSSLWHVRLPSWRTKAALATALTLLVCLCDWAEGTDLVRAGQERALFLLGGIALFTVLRRSLTSPFAAFFAYASVLWALQNYPFHGGEHLLHLAAASILAVWFAQYPEALEFWLTQIGFAEAIFGLAQYFGWNPWHYANSWELFKPSGTFGQETILGAFLAAALAPALFSRRYYAALPIFLCCLATKSTMTTLAAGSVVFLWLAHQWGWFRACILGVICAGVGVDFFARHPDHEFFNFNGRVRFWAWAWNRFRERPLFGFGPGSWLDNAPTFELRLTHAHNEFLEFLTEYGSVGGVIAAWAGSLFALNYRPTWYHAMTVAIFVDSIGNFPYHIASIGTLALTGWILSIRGVPRVLQWSSHGG